jgi:hypothetical protein
MIPSFKKLHYAKNWFAALFHPMSREVLNADSQQPQFFFSMDWSSTMKIYDASRQTLLMDLRWMRASGWRTWEVYVGNKKQGAIRAEILQSILALGTERWSVLNESGEEVLKVNAPQRKAIEHVLDELTNLYNPTHVLTIANLKGATVATISMKHGMFSSFYDLSLEKVTEEERVLILALFSAILLMLRK